MLKKCTIWILGQVETNVCKQQKDKFFYDKHSHLRVTIAFTLYVVHLFFSSHVFTPENVVLLTNSKKGFQEKATK